MKSLQDWVLGTWLALPLAALSLLNTADSALASGFAIIEQSVPGLGNAFAGSAATAEDASTIFFNPAGLTYLQGNSFSGATYSIAPTIRFTNQGSSLATGAPLLGSDGGEAGNNALVPNLYAAWSLSDRIKVGLGVGSPFALATEYNRDWVGRYQGVKSKLTTININPAIAARLTDNLSIGAGVNLQYAKAELSNAIDFGLIGRSVGLPTLPQRADGFVEVEGEDWSWGYNLGVLYAPSANTRIGLAYRSQVTHNLEGDADFSVPTSLAGLTRTGRFTDSDASAKLKLPDTLSLSAYQRLSSKVAIVGDVTWTNWSRFKELRVEFDNPVQPDAVQPENWRDTYRFSLGVNYAVNDTLTLRAGVAYDQSPVKEEFRTVRVPDSNRTWLAVGASYRPSDSLKIDLGYAHIITDRASIDQSNLTEGRVKGEYNNHVDVVGVQVNWSF